MSKATEDAGRFGSGLSEGLGADGLLRAFEAACRSEARAEAAADVWECVAEQVAAGDLREAWDCLARTFDGDERAAVAVLGLVQWLINTGRLAAKHGLDEEDHELSPDCCDQLDAECIGVRLSSGHGTLWIEAPNVRVQPEHPAQQE
jgi:hypothetical protein